MRHVLIVGALLLGSTQSASAGWQQTHWGMSPTEVIAAVGGDAQPAPPAPHEEGRADSLVVSTYQVNAFRFAAEYRFANKKLAEVRLTLDGPTDKKCYALLFSLSAIYGDQDVYTFGNVHSEHWLDIRNGNNINFEIRHADNTCRLYYSGIAPRNAPNGL